MPRAAFPSGRKSLLLFAAVAAAIIGAAWWSQRPPPEPVSNGQRLSAWLYDHDANRSRAEIIDDLHRFGPAAIPWLSYTLEHGRQPFDSEPHLLEHAPDWLRGWFPEKWGGYQESPLFDDRTKAAEVLSILGPEAKPAIPALGRVLERARDGYDFGQAELAAIALHDIGSSSWPVVEQSLKHGNGLVRYAVLSSIDRRVQTEEPPSQAEVAKVFSILVQACDDSDENVRHIVTRRIADYPCRPHLLTLDSFIDQLIRLLSNSDQEVQSTALRILATTGAKGARAIPRMIELLDDRDRDVRMLTAHILSEVDTVEKLSADRLRVMCRDDRDLFCRQTARDTLKVFGFPQEEESAPTIPGLEALPPPAGGSRNGEKVQ